MAAERQSRPADAPFAERSRTIAHSISAPESSRMLEKLAASMLACCSASRHSSELAAKATIAAAVSSAVRSKSVHQSVREAVGPDVAQDRRRDLLDRFVRGRQP